MLLRVDWNIPLDGELAAEDSLKLTRSYATIQELVSHGAIVIVMTHLGRPKGVEKKYSTQQLAKAVERGLKLPVHFLPMLIDSKAGLADAQKRIEKAEPGTIFLLENVRFLKGEETNAPSLAKALGSLGDLFVNDAFASCHRAHASVVGVAKVLPSFAGPSLIAEVEGLTKLIEKPKHPFVAVVGGAKLSTKMEVLTSLLEIADVVMVGGAMAHPFFVAQKKEIGKSFLEKESIPLAKKLLKNKKLMLPLDAVVATSLDGKSTPRVAQIDEVKKRELIGDIGTETMREWSNVLRNAKTIVWNGPVGVSEVPAFSHGSRVIAEVVAARSKGTCYGVIGGGDTLPIILASGMSDWIDHLSTGGGAMLEFIAKRGKLPGLDALAKKKS